MMTVRELLIALLDYDADDPIGAWVMREESDPLGVHWTFGEDPDGNPAIYVQLSDEDIARLQ